MCGPEKKKPSFSSKKDKVYRKSCGIPIRLQIIKIITVVTHIQNIILHMLLLSLSINKPCITKTEVVAEAFRLAPKGNSELSIKKAYQVTHISIYTCILLNSHLRTCAVSKEAIKKLTKFDTIHRRYTYM